jgi:hypothetical protein
MRNNVLDEVKQAGICSVCRNRNQRTKGQTTICKTLHRKHKDRVKRTSLKVGGELKCTGRVFSSYSTGGTRRVTLVDDKSRPFVLFLLVIVLSSLIYDF